MEYLVLLVIPAVSLVIGYLFGKNDVDPNTLSGKAHYGNITMFEPNPNVLLDVKGENE